MRKLLILLLLLPLAALAQNGYTTTFSATENPISQGGSRWIGGASVGLDWHDVRTTTNQAYGTQTGSTNYDDSLAVLTGSWQANQTAQATVFKGTDSGGQFKEVEVLLNFTITAHSASGYEINCSVKSGDQYMQIVRWNGPKGNFTLLDARPVGCTQGDILKATHVGSTITAYKNGVSQFSVTDNTYTGGAPGIGFYLSNGVVGNNVEFGLSSFTAYDTGAVVNTSSCLQVEIANALATVSSGGSITTPAGNCSWSGLTINKAVTLSGAGAGSTNISLTGNNTITKAAAGNIRIKNFGFSTSGGGNAFKAFTIGGSWKSAKPYIFQNNSFNISGSGLFLLSVNGGLFSQNTFIGGWDDSFIQFKDPTDAEGSWTAVDSMGTNDTNGEWNTYVENNTFTGGANQGIDCDDSCRMVFRYNLTVNFDFNSHGLGTSSIGTRHWEIYANDMRNTCSRGTDCSNNSNQNHHNWLRGGTGVIYDNLFDNLNTTTWGDKPEIYLAQDTNNSGGCPADGSSYPLSHQLGRGYNGSSQFTDPIYLWNNNINTGTGNLPRTLQTTIAWQYGCATPISGYVQSLRDYFDNSGGSSSKPGYVAYTYPHPLSGQVITNYTLSVSKTGAGSGTVTGGTINCGGTCSQIASAGTVITLSASAAGGSTFNGWSGGGCAGTGTCVVTLNNNTNVTADFTLNVSTPRKLGSMKIGSGVKF